MPWEDIMPRDNVLQHSPSEVLMAPETSSLLTAALALPESERAVERIAATPDLWAPFGRNHRWVRAGRFPYILYYRKAGPDHILVVAVAHSRRRPGYWARR